MGGLMQSIYTGVRAAIAISLSLLIGWGMVLALAAWRGI